MPSPGASPQCPGCGAPLATPSQTCGACGRFLPPGLWGQSAAEPLPAEVPAEVGLVIEGRYRVDGLISRGGMGAVFKGTDLTLRRAVAIKFLADRLRGDPDVVERFIREARTTASLDHPNVIPVYAVGEEGGRYYFVMKYLAGRTVTQLIRAKGRLPLAQTLHIMLQICDGLEHVHRRGFVHRDVKPNNIMVDASGQSILLDFGILRILDTRHTHTGLIAGTPEYMAPEQAKNAAGADARSDLYALGITIFEMLTGRLPFDAPNTFELLLQHHSAPPPSAVQLSPDLPPAVDSLLARALAKDPDDRFQTAADLKTALLSLTGHPALTLEPAPPPAEPRSVRSTPPTAPARAAPRSVAPIARPPSQEPQRRGAESTGAFRAPGATPAPPPRRRRRSRWGIALAFGLFGLWGAFVIAFFLLRYGQPVIPLDSVPRRPLGEPAAFGGTAAASPRVGTAAAPLPLKANGTARLGVRSEPSKALVRVGSSELGKTPLRSVKIAAGSHEIVVEKEGYAPWRQLLHFQDGDSRSISARLEPLPATLKIYTFKEGSMTWATISVGDRSLGSSPILGHQVAAGKHLVVARRPGYRHAKKWITVKPGEEKRVVLDLKLP